ncbi:MAG: hypothetical protein RL684_2477, partial [Pseudomonadota bacterium]
RAPSITIAPGGLSLTKNSIHATQWGCALAATLTAGAWYWETTVTFTATSDVAVGVATAALPLTTRPGSDAAGLSIAISKDGQVRLQNTLVASLGALASGARIRLWLDIDGQRLLVAVNGGAWALCQLPDSMLGVALLPIVGLLLTSAPSPGATANFGASPFVYEVPDEAHTGAYIEPAPEPLTIYLGSEGFNHVPWVDDPLSTLGGYWDYGHARHYEGRISDEADVETEREGGCWVWGNQTVSRPGQLTIVNADGALDAWRDYLWRDAEITLLAGYEGDRYDDFTLWTRTTVDSVERTPEGNFILRLADPLAVFDRALQPNLYPDNQPNTQAVGQPKRIVIGRPLYCEGVLLDTNPTVRDYQLHDGEGGLAGAGAGLTRIDAIFDRGNRFAGPDDAYIANNPITLANGGAFTTWAADGAGIQMPQNFARVTGFGATNDRFQQGVTAGTLRLLSSGQMETAIYHSVSSVLTGYRYTISFDVTAVGKAGQFLFRADGPTPNLPFDEAVVAIVPAHVGTRVSVTLDITEQAQLQIVLGRTELDVTIDNLTVSSTQIIDWTYLLSGANRIGFHLANKPAGKVVANPVGPGAGGVPYETLTDVMNYVLARGWRAAERTGLAPTVTASANAIRASADYRIATFESKPKTALALLREIMNSWCGWIVPTRDGSLAVGRVSAPVARRSVLTLDETNLIDAAHIADDVAKGLSVRIAGRRNHAVHSDGDLATSVTAAQRAELTTEMTVVRTGAPAISSAPVSAAYAQAVGAPAQATLLQDAADIQREANRVATLWRPKRSFYSASALLGASIADSLEPGQVVRLVWSSDGLQAGKYLLVVGVRARFFGRRVDLKLWG